VPRKKQLWIAVGVLVFAAGYFVLDVRQRARVDRGPKRHRTDFTVYQAAAQALVQGEDPYEARNPRGYRYVYPPLLAVLLMPVARWAPPEAALVFFLLSAASLLYALLALLRFRPSREGPALGFAALLVAGITCLGFAHQGFQRGQITHVLLALHVAALVSLYRGRFGWAGFWLALGGALRLTPLLAAAAVGIGLLGAVRAHGLARPLRFGGGLAAGLLLGFVLVPLVALGADRAREVGQRWLEVTASVYRENEDLDAAYRINEWRFKNQAPRRVYGTWAGWATGAAFEKERPDLAAGPRRWVDGLAAGTSWLLLVGSLLLGAFALRTPGTRAYAVAFAAVTLLPVLITRYAWPTHYLLALPAVALAAAPLWHGRALRGTRWVLLVGALLFYAAHARPLEWIGAAGCLMLACVVFLAAFLRHGLVGRRA